MDPTAPAPDGAPGGTGPATPPEPAPPAESPRPEPPRPEPPKAEPPKAQPPKTEPPKAEPPKAEPPKAEPPKVEPPKAEPPKAEPPRPIEPPKPEPPRPPAPLEPPAPVARPVPPATPATPPSPASPASPASPPAAPPPAPPPAAPRDAATPPPPVPPARAAAAAPAVPARRRSVWRLLRSLLTFGFALATLSTLVLAFALYLAATGRNLPMLRGVVSLIGRAVDGQRTTALAARLELRPGERALGGETTLTVQAAGGPRERLYFLLNEGLRVRGAWHEDEAGTRTALPLLRLWLLTIVDLPEALADGAETRVTIAYDGTLGAGVANSGAVLEPDDVVLTAADFWYPADVQGAFAADVEIALPADLTLVHNGREEQRIVAGTQARVRFASERPVTGLALVAGRYTAHERTVDGQTFRVLLPPEASFDPARLLGELAGAERGLAGHFGPSGFSGSTLFISRRLTRAFNDGSGLLGIPPRYFHDGRYGYEIVAHELAHNWWGATVAERWLAPGTGGEWVVEGFAQYAGWRAVAERFGEAARVETLARNFFDPAATGVLADMSVLDNALDPEARATIYQKGGWVTAMLATQLGAETFDAAARALLEELRYRPATDGDVERVFTAVSGQDLAPFFAAWVHGTAVLDLALEPQDGHAAVRALRDAPAPAPFALRRDGDAEAPAPVTIGEVVPLAGAQRLLLDPLAATADMYRSNNVLPRADHPRQVARSARGELLVVDGEPPAWEPATVRIVAPGGATLHTWLFERGLAAPARWSADGTRVLALESARDGRPTLLALNSGDGSRRTLGHDRIAAADADGTLVARDGLLLRLGGPGGGTVLIRHDGARIVSIRPAPAGGAIAYALVRDQTLELRLLAPGGSDSRVLFTWPAMPLRWEWAPDGARLFAALPGDWDWQLWAVPADGSAPRRLVHDAARIVALAPAPDSQRVALVAQAELDEPAGRTEIILLDARSRDVRRISDAATTFRDVTWLDDETLAVVTASATEPAIPQARVLQRLRLADGRLEAM